MSNLSELAIVLFELREQKAEINNSLKDVQSKLLSAEEELLEEMGHEGMARLDLANCGSFTVANRKFYKIADRDMLMDFIHEQGDTDLLTVNHNTLNAYAKEMYDRKEQEGNTEFSMPGVEFITKTQIRVRKTRS